MIIQAGNQARAIQGGSRRAVVEGWDTRGGTRGVALTCGWVAAAWPGGGRVSFGRDGPRSCTSVSTKTSTAPGGTNCPRSDSPMSSNEQHSGNHWQCNQRRTCPRFSLESPTSPYAIDGGTYTSHVSPSPISCMHIVQPCIICRPRQLGEAIGRQARYSHDAVGRQSGGSREAVSGSGGLRQSDSTSGDLRRFPHLRWDKLEGAAARVRAVEGGAVAEERLEVALARRLEQRRAPGAAAREFLVLHAAPAATRGVERTALVGTGLAVGVAHCSSGVCRPSSAPIDGVRDSKAARKHDDAVRTRVPIEPRRVCRPGAERARRRIRQ